MRSIIATGLLTFEFLWKRMTWNSYHPSPQNGACKVRRNSVFSCVKVSALRFSTRPDAQRP